jgi:hypothetical protein
MLGAFNKGIKTAFGASMKLTDVIGARAGIEEADIVEKLRQAINNMKITDR